MSGWVFLAGFTGMLDSFVFFGTGSSADGVESVFFWSAFFSDFFRSDFFFIMVKLEMAKKYPF